MPFGTSAKSGKRSQERALHARPHSPGGCEQSSRPYGQYARPVKPVLEQQRTKRRQKTAKSSERYILESALPRGPEPSSYLWSRFIHHTSYPCETTKGNVAAKAKKELKAHFWWVIPMQETCRAHPINRLSWLELQATHGRAPWRRVALHAPAGFLALLGQWSSAVQSIAHGIVFVHQRRHRRLRDPHRVRV